MNRINHLTRVLTLSLLACAPGISHGQTISFEDKTSAAGFSYSGESWGASWGDYNGDGRPDLFTNNHRTFESVYRNNGNGTFTNVAQQIDVVGTWAAEWNSDTHGATWADFDNDGDQDLMVANGYPGGGSSPPNSYGWRFFVNENAMLVDRTTQYGFRVIPGGSGGRFPGWFDVNNDGLLDLLTLNQNTTAQLYIQNGSHTFNNTGGQLQSCRSNHVLLISDIDVDGRAEMICPQKDAFPDKIYDTSTYPAPFRDETSSVPFVSLVQDTVLADFNNDLRPDIFHVRGGKRMSGATQGDSTSVEAQIIVDKSAEKTMSFVSSGVLSVDSSWEYVNKTTAYVYIGSLGIHPSSFKFTLDPANSNTWGIKPHSPSMSSQIGIYIGYDPNSQTWKFSVSPGGYWQLVAFQIGSTSSISNVAVSNLLAVDMPQKPSLYMNTLAGFTQNLIAAGLNQVMSCVDAVAGDFDNDMDQDLFLVCREASGNIEDRLYQNQGNGTFTRVTGAGGAAGVIGSAIRDGAGTGESAVTADYDSDGFLDLFVTNGLNESYWRVGGPVQLFRNHGNGNHWIELDLQGTLTNRDGIGARVIATTSDGTTQLREQNGGFHRWSQNSSRLHFGLGSNTSVALRVEWPSGVVDNFSVTDVDHIYHIAEMGLMTVVDLGPPPAPSPCGPPTYNKATEQAVFIWKNCSAGTWSARMVAGGASWVVYKGNVQSSENFTSVSGFSIEANDTLNVSDPSNIVYSLGAGGSSEDGFNFAFPASAAVCFNPTAPPGVPVYLGADRTLMTGPFNLSTLGSCN